MQFLFALEKQSMTRMIDMYDQIVSIWSNREELELGDVNFRVAAHHMHSDRPNA